MSSALLLFFCRQKDFMQIRYIRFTLKSIELMATSVHIWCEKMSSGQKFASDTELQSVVCHWLGQQHHLASFFSSGMPFRSLLRDGTKCLNKLGQYVEK